MKKIMTFILIMFILSPTFYLFGCVKTGSNSNGKVIRVCNCEDYIDESIFDDFTKETGIEVIYSTYGTNENLYNELVINPNSYDLVVPSEYMIEKLAVEGRIQPLTQKADYQTYLTDYDKNISPFIKNKLKNIKIKDGKYKNDNLSLYDFMVGYMWGTMGWVYNTEVVSQDDVKNWFSPFNNSDIHGRITIKDAVRDSYLVGLAMVNKEELLSISNDNDAITEILNRTDRESINKVGEKLSSLKDKLYGFEVDSGKNDIVLGNIDAYVAWSGDAAYAIDVGAGVYDDEELGKLEDDQLKALSYYIPDEGSNIWFDGFVMPSGSTNYDAVYKFLEFISRSSTVFANMDETGYTSMIANGDEFEVEVKDKKGNVVEVYSTQLFDEVFIGWFDESEYLAYELIETAEFSDKTIDEILIDIEQMTEQELQEYGYGLADLSEFEYFFGDISDDYRLVICEDSWGRLISQYPTESQVERCAVMSYFDSETLMDINEMWEHVKGETWPWWVIILIISLVVLFAISMVLFKHREKFKWLKLPERKTTYAERKGLKEISRVEIKL